LTTLAANAVTVRFGHGHGRLTAVDGVDLTVPDRATVGLVGESGSGKSTLVRALSGLTPLVEGEVLLDGAPVRQRHGGRAVDARRRVQMIFQDPFASLNPRMTVGEAVGEAVGVRGGAGRGTRRKEVQRYLELVHLDPQTSSQRPSRLSGGQRQRVAIARAVLRNAPILLLDEATSALDSESETLVQRALDAIMQGRTTLVIAHRLATVTRADRILVLDEGRLVEEGTHQSLLGNGGIYARLAELQFATDAA